MLFCGVAVAVVAAVVAAVVDVVVAAVLIQCLIINSNSLKRMLQLLFHHGSLSPTNAADRTNEEQPCCCC